MLDAKLKDVAAQEAIARMAKRVDKADKSVVGASTKKRKTKKPDKFTLLRLVGHLDSRRERLQVREADKWAVAASRHLYRAIDGSVDSFW